MRRADLPPDALRARGWVRAFIAADVFFFAVALTWAAVDWDVLILLPGIPIAGVFLVVDAGAWDFDPDDLGKRRGLGFLGLLAAVAVVLRSSLRWEERTGMVWLLFALVLAILSLSAVILFSWARGVSVRSARHLMGSGGVAPQMPASATSAEGFPSCWVGRRK